MAAGMLRQLDSQDALEAPIASRRFALEELLRSPCCSAAPAAGWLPAWLPPELVSCSLARSYAAYGNSFK